MNQSNKQYISVSINDLTNLNYFLKSKSSDNVELEYSEELISALSVVAIAFDKAKNKSVREGK